jgi:hypothetical protein
MIIQMYSDELHYCNAKLHPFGARPGSFLELICHAALRADAQNYEILRPLIHVMMSKYPADKERLDAEQRNEL